MFAYIAGYMGASVVFCLMDFLWLTILAKKFYQAQMGSLMLDEPRLGPAAAFYILYIVGLFVFAVVPALRAQSILVALGLGAFLGLIAYSSYDLTNFAVLKGWSLSLTLVDITWGILVSAVSSVAGFLVVRIFASNQT